VHGSSGTAARLGASGSADPGRQPGTASTDEQTNADGDDNIISHRLPIPKPSIPSPRPRPSGKDRKARHGGEDPRPQSTDSPLPARSPPSRWHHTPRPRKAKFASSVRRLDDVPLVTNQGRLNQTSKAYNLAPPACHRPPASLWLLWLPRLLAPAIAASQLAGPAAAGPPGGGVARSAEAGSTARATLAAADKLAFCFSFLGSCCNFSVLFVPPALCHRTA
jgi:hypothetical protein